MQAFRDNVGVVTGGASGIGRAMVDRFAAEGMKIVVADVVNTASLAGLTSNPFLDVYNVTKHAVVTLSETLAQELAVVGASVKVSVLCPGFVQTQIADSDRNRPPALRDGAERARPEGFKQIVRAAIAAGLAPAAVADLVFAAIRDERFYVLPHREQTLARVRTRMEDILEERAPTTASPLRG